MASLTRHGVFMNTPQTPDAASPDADGMAADDPRVGFAVVTKAVSDLIIQTTDEQLSFPTPCSEFDVKDLLDHLVMVMRRVAVIGNGGHFSEVTQEGVAREAGHADSFGEAADDTRMAWTDSAKLGQMFEVPWGEIPAAPLLSTYTAELAAHGWDLAIATGRPFEIADEYLGGALFAVRMIPAEGRGPEMPFDPVVDPGENASNLRKIAGWVGRQVV